MWAANTVLPLLFEIFMESTAACVTTTLQDVRFMECLCLRCEVKESEYTGKLDIHSEYVFIRSRCKFPWNDIFTYHNNHKHFSTSYTYEYIH